ncbi:oxidoreductase [Brevundimonas variabilis]|uniref:Putative dehydrogenase n=1 Tax=Brevundimonas variabilis TaxID=74312 RepID=A0A7W9CGR5_9CAUL|nr:oxidoreductase [Brevundimonas variabilis]MBB5745294.1 putative dehydrogenase [Brevundimonas variabilis]
MAQQTPINVGLIGFGYAGRTFHAPLIAATEGLRLHSIVSSQPEAVGRAWPGARVIADIERLFGDGGVDLVVIATPNDLHAPLARRALQAGRHVVVDKPFTLTVAEGRDLAALARSADRLLSVFHNRRWDADFIAVRALVEAGTLGTIGRMESRFDRFRPERRDRWRERDTPGAGLWYDLGPHLIDQALVLFGRPLAITADIQTQRAGVGADDYAHAVLRYARRRVVLHADMLSAVQPFRFALHGDQGSFLITGLDPQEDALKAGEMPGGEGWGVDPTPGTLTRADGNAALQPGPPGDYLAYYRAIERAIRGLGPNPVPPDQAVAVMEVLEAGFRSSRLRMEIRLS